MAENNESQAEEPDEPPPTIPPAPPTPPTPPVPPVDATPPVPSAPPIPPANAVPPTPPTPPMPPPGPPPAGFGPVVPPPTGAPGAPFPPQSSGTDSTAIASMVTGIAAIVFLFCCLPVGIVAGIIALVFGIMARNKLATSNQNGAGFALTGIILGAVSLGLGAIFIVLYFVASVPSVT